MNKNDNNPIYSIGMASEILSVHPRTLRIYENESLIKPFRKGGKRFFSANDLKWIKCLRALIHDENISIPGIKKLLEYAPCWKIRNCNEKENCTVSCCKERNCWEMAKKTCKKSCQNCEEYGLT
ncbi:MAG: MerR family transcriptional regulator [Candidatus Gastranaerophilales bacterium]|nr:MerR family transcriptional regulator [Candidatus Gastranaerophilales bacterium]